ncbi:ZINC FINGER RING/FYVE/PHD-TYPE [Salix purpurea]|uniref:RING-type E3 ubiquitin transferase n=1 Tax=Salix purpurea TaxID=77065 RepID=A0A9Q1ACZ1_SALPP|nr:ZINC FINGER RING/FYVE/PHD-TYPE [Salix purpurea]
MGSVCCCLHADDLENYMNPENSVNRNCMCLSCFVQKFLHVYTSIFQRGQLHSVSSSIQGAASLSTSSSLDNSLADLYRSPPRPLPYDADPRCFRLQRDGLVSRRDKGSSHSLEESEPLRRDDDVDSESFSTGDRWNVSACEDGGKEQRSRSSLKLSSAKAIVGNGYVYSSSEEEDVCPTCLDEYTPENPKIMTKCSHHFHLGCIYEWMERSDSCSVCGKELALLHDFLVSDDSNFISLNCIAFCTQFRGSDIALPHHLGARNVFMQLRFERLTENLLFCPLLAHELLEKTFGYSGLLLKTCGKKL